MRSATSRSLNRILSVGLANGNAGTLQSLPKNHLTSISEKATSKAAMLVSPPGRA